MGIGQGRSGVGEAVRSTVPPLGRESAPWGRRPEKPLHGSLRAALESCQAGPRSLDPSIACPAVGGYLVAAATTRMSLAFTLFLLALGLFAGMLGAIELGRWLARRRSPEAERGSVVAAEGAVFALLGLLVAFTFSGAATRFDGRRELITKEANAIGSAWRLLDLLPAEAQPGVRAHFADYVGARLAAYRVLPDEQAARAELARAARHEAELWRGVLACRAGSGADWEKLLLPALNSMSDVAGERTGAILRHPPRVVFALLFVLALGCALLTGLAMSGGGRAPRTILVGFAAVISLTAYVILDLEYPRVGLIRVDASDQVLIDLHAGMR